MTFREAKKMLREIAGDRYYTIKKAETYFCGTLINVRCSVFITNYSWHSSNTFERAIVKLKIEMEENPHD